MRDDVLAVSCGLLIVLMLRNVHRVGLVNSRVYICVHLHAIQFLSWGNQSFRAVKMPFGFLF